MVPLTSFAFIAISDLLLLAGPQISMQAACQKMSQTISGVGYKS